MTEPSAAATVHSSSTWGIVFPAKNDFPDFRAAGLSISVSKHGIVVFVPQDNALALGERRTLAFNIPIYEQDSAGCSNKDDLKSFFDCDRSGPKNVRFFWDVRIVVGGYREFFGAFVGEAPINGLLPPVPEDTFILPTSEEEFSFGEFMLFGNAGLPKNLSVAGGGSGTWRVNSDSIGESNQHFTPGRLVGADGAFSERLTLAGTVTLQLDSGVDAILELDNNDLTTETQPEVYVKVSVDSENIAYPARGRFHLTLYSRPEQIDGRDTPAAIVHFYYDIVAPGRTRGDDIPVRTETGPWPFHTVSDVPVTVGPVFDRRSRPGNRPADGAHFGVVGGLSYDRLCGQHPQRSDFPIRAAAVGRSRLSVFRTMSSFA